MVPQPLVGQDVLFEVPRSHSDTKHSVGLLLTSDQPDTKTSTWQHTTLTRDIHVPGGIRTRNSSKRAAVDPRLRSNSHWDRQIYVLTDVKFTQLYEISSFCDRAFGLRCHGQGTTSPGVLRPVFETACLSHILGPNDQYISNFFFISHRRIPKEWRIHPVLFAKSLSYNQSCQLTRRINPLNPELNPICYLLALLGAHHFLHASRIRVKLLTFRLLMSYIYGAPILDVSRSHTTTQHSR